MLTPARIGRHALALSLVAALAGPAPMAWATSSIQSGSGAAPRMPGATQTLAPVQADGVSALPSETRELLVAFDLKSTSVAAITNAHRSVHARPKRMFSIVPGLQLVELPDGMSAEDAIRQYEAMPGVRYAEPNRTYDLAVGPNDPLFSRQWGYDNNAQTGGTADADVDAVEAWAHETGSSSVVVAVVDTGVDYLHPDLAPNLWFNTDEIPGNGADDDNNGWVDDVHGIDTVSTDGDPMDDHGHGTHVTGTIGAVGDNGVGVAGMSWDVQIMALKAFDARGNEADVLTALQYARDNGATVVNCSWGTWLGTPDLALRDAMAASPALFVCAAGNGGTDGVADDNDGAQPFYPASFDLPNILSVGASDSQDKPASFSNHGATSVDVFAPGKDILSTYLPEVSGIAPDATVNVLMQDQFSDLADWQTNYQIIGRPMLPSWALKSSAFTSAPYSVGVTGYVNSQFSMLVRATAVDLTSADNPGMRYRARVDTELNYDFLVAGMLEGLKMYPAGWLTGDSQETFIEQMVDLSDYAATNTYKPYFALDADESYSSAQGYEGVYVDDLEVFDIDPGASGEVWTYDYANAYALMDGTSMAAPHVSGLAALLLAQEPTRDAAAIKSKILGSVDAKASLAGKCVTGGRINAHAALNRAPVAGNDSYTVTSGVKRTVTAPGVLSNDTDDDGDAKTAMLAAGPAHGTLVFNQDGSFDYTSVSGYTGTDTFCYKAKDDLSQSTSATVTITVNAAPPTSTLTPVYRFYNFKNGTHFFTPSEEEKAQVMATLLGTYQYEGEAYRLNPANNSAQLYRFYNVQNGSHFYTADPAEANKVMTTLSHIFQYDGRTYAVNPTQVTDSKPVYRFYNVLNGSHFYTADEAERADVQARLWQTYQYEGPAFWLGQ